MSPMLPPFYALQNLLRNLVTVDPLAVVYDIALMVLTFVTFVYQTIMPFNIDY